MPSLNHTSVLPLSAPACPIKLTVEPLLFPLPFLNQAKSIPKFSIFRARWTLRTCAECSCGDTAAVGALSPYFSSRFGRNQAHRRLLSLPSPPRRGHAARSLPKRCEHLQQNYSVPLMLPMSLIVSLWCYNAKSEALRGRGNGAAVGLSSRRAPCLFFLPYRVRLIALVTLVVFILFGVARNAFPASSEELTSSVAMAPPCSVLAQGSPPPFSPRAIRSVFSGSDYIPL